MTNISGTGNDELDRVLASLGYAYDSKQDIFYSTLDAWQRNLGYFYLYDEAAPFFNMIIDCEPIFFTYGAKRWLIQLWKGQYGITTGCEVGVYTTTRPDLYIPGVFNGPFFDCASDEDLLHIACTLYKKDVPIFTREDVHWWVTGFILGAFSEPSDLTMEIKITLKDKDMHNAFITGFIEAGYYQEELVIEGNEVSLKFAEPRTPQPSTRNPASDKRIQKQNKLLCDLYKRISAPFTNLQDKLKSLEVEAPELVTLIGKNKPLYERYDIVKNYVE